MLKLNKLKLVCCFTFISLSQNSFSMCFRRAVKPLLNNVRLSNLNKRMFANLSQRALNTKKFNYSQFRFYSTEQTKSEDINRSSWAIQKFLRGKNRVLVVSKEREFVMGIDDKNFKELLSFYRSYPKKEKYRFSKYDNNDRYEYIDYLYCNSDNLRMCCMSIIKDISRKDMLTFCSEDDLDYALEVTYFFNDLAKLVGELIKRGDNEFAEILIKWSFESKEEIQRVHKYIEDKEIDHLVCATKKAFIKNLTLRLGSSGYLKLSKHDYKINGWFAIMPQSWENWDKEQITQDIDVFCD